MTNRKKILLGSASVVMLGGLVTGVMMRGSNPDVGSGDDVLIAHIAKPASTEGNGGSAGLSPVSRPMATGQRAPINANGEIVPSDRKYRRVEGKSPSSDDVLTMDANWCKADAGWMVSYMELGPNSKLATNPEAQRLMASSIGAMFSKQCLDAKKQTVIFEDSMGRVISRVTGVHPTWVPAASATETQVLDLDVQPVRGAIITFNADEVEPDGKLIKSRPIGKYTVSDGKPVALKMDEPLSLLVEAKRTPYPRFGAFSVSMAGSLEVPATGEYKITMNYGGPPLVGLPEIDRSPGARQVKQADKCEATVSINGKAVTTTASQGDVVGSIPLAAGYHNMVVTMRCALQAKLARDMAGRVHGDGDGMAARFLQSISVKIIAPGATNPKLLRYTDLQFSPAS